MEAKDKILEALKEGRKSTSRIAGIVGIDYNYANKLLKDLKSEKKVKEIEETNATYWELKTKIEQKEGDKTPSEPIKKGR